LAHTSFKEATELARKRSKVSLSFRVGGFYGYFESKVILKAI
jgi:hypothetical protein